MEKRRVAHEKSRVHLTGNVFTRRVSIDEGAKPDKSQQKQVSDYQRLKNYLGGNDPSTAQF